MPRLCTLVGFALLTLAGPASSEASLRLKLAPVKVVSPAYEAIAFVTEGSAYGHTDGQLRGRYHRVLFIEPAVAYARPSIRLETITYGDEGCCRRVIGAWELGLQNLEATGVSLPEATSSQLRFVRWLTPRSVEIRYGTLVCQIAGIGKPAIEVACKT
jgi:hypothetical protein